MLQATLRFARQVGFVSSFAAGLAACTLPSQDAEIEPGVFKPTPNGPEDAPDGTCWGKTISPAVIESAEERVLVKPAEINPDGSIAKLPVYRTETRQVIVTPRQNNWFETPCPDVQTEDFSASLQRALQARGYYDGPINGENSAVTQAAVQKYQKEKGLDSPVLSLESARELGLVAMDRETLN